MQPFLDAGCNYEYTTLANSSPILTVDLDGATMKADARTSTSTSIYAITKTINININGSATFISTFTVAIKVYPCSLTVSLIPTLTAAVYERKE
jgi:hypothetical protein